LSNDVAAGQLSAPQTFSPDGGWWWSGTDWKPAISPDRRFRFDGEKWVQIRRRSLFPIWSILPTFGWIILLGLWLPLSIITFRADNPSHDTLVWAIGGGSIIVLATLALGFVFGATRRALWLWLVILPGSFAQNVGYLIFAQRTAAVSAPGTDMAMGLGAFFLSIPIFLAVLVCIWLGAGLGRLAAELRKWTRSRPRSTGQSSPTVP
jgi:hypothetical protein